MVLNWNRTWVALLVLVVAVIILTACDTEDPQVLCERNLWHDQDTLVEARLETDTGHDGVITRYAACVADTRVGDDEFPDGGRYIYEVFVFDHRLTAYTWYPL